MSNGPSEEGWDTLAKAAASLAVLGALAFDPIPGDIVLAPPIISSIWAVDVED